MKKSVAVVAGAVMAMGLATPAFADAEANGVSTGAPGVLSGNVVQAPLHLPTALCGNTVDALALLNPSFGSSCVTG